MTTEPTQLAAKIAVYIAKNHPVDYETLEARAKTHGIPIAAFLDAMTIIHRSKSIEAKSTAHGIVYTVTVAKTPVGPASHLMWVNDNYPRSVVCTHCKGAWCEECIPFYDSEKDTKEKLIMTREEFKALTTGRTFVPKNQYYDIYNKIERDFV